MNRHIEKINPYLIGIKFCYVRMGWIKDIPPFHENTASVVTDDGILILNKDNELYEALKNMFHLKIMPLSDKDLELHIQETKARQGLPNFDYVDEDVYCKGYLNRTQIQYTAKGSSVADSSSFARKRRVGENINTSECHTLLLRIA